MLDFDKILTSPKHYCHKMPDQNGFFWDIRVDDWMGMFDLNITILFNFYIEHQNQWK
jgi:hypothetical protein